MGFDSVGGDIRGPVSACSSTAPLGGIGPHPQSGLSTVLVAAALTGTLLAGCMQQVVEDALNWCRRNEGELQQLAKAHGIDYHELMRLAYASAPVNGNQEERQAAYWAYVERNTEYRALCDEATRLRRGVEDWTAPPPPTRTPGPGGEP